MVSIKERLRKVLDEPLLRFFLIGAVIFAVLAQVEGHRQPTVRIDATEIEQLVTYWKDQSQREPSREELTSIINERVDEEVLAQEAKRLGLDQNDIIIRRRLAQKMAFLSQDSVELPDPDEAQLVAFYNANKLRYSIPGQIALRQVFFSADRVEISSQIAATEALSSLRAGKTTVAGDPLMLPLTYASVTIEDLARDYGDEFAAEAAQAALGVWVGPVRSALGLHLIKVEKREKGKVASFADVRDEVTAAWINEQRLKLSREELTRIRNSYRIEVAELPE